MRPSYLRPRDRGNYKESAACPITKASNCFHFHIPLFFLFSTFPAMQYQRFFFLFLIRFLFVRETEAIIRKVPLVRSPKQVIFLIFILLLCFCSLLSQPYSIRVFSVFDTFTHLRNFNNAFSIEFTIPQGQQHATLAQQSYVPVNSKTAHPPPPGNPLAFDSR